MIYQLFQLLLITFSWGSHAYQYQQWSKSYNQLNEQQQQSSSTTLRGIRYQINNQNDRQLLFANTASAPDLHTQDLHKANSSTSDISERRKAKLINNTDSLPDKQNITSSKCNQPLQQGSNEADSCDMHNSKGNGPTTKTQSDTQFAPNNAIQSSINDNDSQVVTQSPNQFHQDSNVDQQQNQGTRDEPQSSNQDSDMQGAEQYESKPTSSQKNILSDQVTDYGQMEKFSPAENTPPDSRAKRSDEKPALDQTRSVSPSPAVAPAQGPMPSQSNQSNITQRRRHLSPSPFQARETAPAPFSAPAPGPAPVSDYEDSVCIQECDKYVFDQLTSSLLILTKDIKSESSQAQFDECVLSNAVASGERLAAVSDLESKLQKVIDSLVECCNANSQATDACINELQLSSSQLICQKYVFKPEIELQIIPYDIDCTNPQQRHCGVDCQIFDVSSDVSEGEATASVRSISRNCCGCWCCCKTGFQIILGQAPCIQCDRACCRKKKRKKKLKRQLKKCFLESKTKEKLKCKLYNK